MKEKWINDMRRKLENHQMDPPPGLWDDICKQMGLSPEPVRKPTTTKRLYWVAAAVLALVGCFVVYEMSDSRQPLQAEVVAQQQTSLPSSEPMLARQSPSQQQEDIVRLRQTSQISRSSSLSLNQGDKLLDDAAELQSRTCPLDSVNQMEEHPDNQTNRPMIQPSPHYQATESPDSYVTTTKHSSGSGQWTIGLKASSGLLAVNNSMQTNRLYKSQSLVIGYDSYANASTEISFNFPSTSYTITEYEAKHQLPLRLGLSLQYQLNPHLALLSGISYTRLSSEFSFPLYQNISYSQKLHYIGIPFSVVWQLLTANRFSLYLSGGAMVEKCVSVAIDGDYTGKKPWQWSLNAAAGAEYAFTSLLGAYIEPSLGYYLSDGTQLEHYYKEHPLAPSIEFGLRMHFGR